MKNYISILFVLLLCCFGKFSKAQVTINNITTTMPSCWGSCNGSLNINATGNGGLTYQISGYNPQSSPLFVSLCPSIYTVTVTDAMSFTATSTIGVWNPSQFTISTSLITQPSCTTLGSICFYGYGGVLPYTFNIGPNVGTLSSNCFSNLTPGSYSIMGVDANGCTSFISGVTMNNSPTLSVTGFKLTDSSCAGGLSKAKVNVTGGTPPYSYSWNTNPVQNNDTAFNIPAGSYTCTVVDNGGCNNTTVVHFQGNNQWYVVADTICVNEQGYSYLAQNYGNAPFGTGTTVQPTLGAAVYSNAILFTPPTTTTYTVTGSTAGSCQTQATVTIVVKSLNNAASLVSTDPNCANSHDGNIVVNVSPPNPNLDYFWSNNSSNNSAFNLNLNPGQYSVMVRDSAINGCMILKDTLVALGTNCGDIVGKIVWDSNANCVMDAGEIGVANAKVVINPGGYFTYTNWAGNYYFNGIAYGTYTLVNTPNAISFSNACTNNVATTINSGNPVSTVNFLDSFNNTVNYHIYEFGQCMSFAQGVDYKFLTYGHNVIGQTLPAQIYAVFDSIQQFASSLPAASSISGDTVFWNVNVGPSFNQIKINFNITGSTPIGTAYHVNAGYSSYTGTDLDSTNNKINFTVFACVSADPNNKEVSPAGQLAQGYIPKEEKTMNYNINFQNTGNAPAVNVVIVDTISSKLDISTLQVLGASHSYFVEIKDSIVKFKFPLIMLPDSVYDEPNSHGHITYTIKQKPNLSIGSVMKNTAHIYFDYNTEIVTNTTTSTIYDHLSNNPTATFRNTSCNLPCGNGAIVMQSIGGVSPYSYSITPSCGNTTVNGNQINNLLGGTYTVQTIDAIGNSLTNVAIIQNPIPIVLNLSTTQPIGQLGSASLAPTGGTPPYDYLWLPGNFTTSSISGLGAGNYSVNIVDANGCSDSTSFILNYATSMQDMKAGEWLQLYPNPANNALNIEANFPLQVILIYNQQGQVVMKVIAGQNQKIAIPLTQLAKGIYTMQVGKGDVKRFTIQ